MPTSSDEPVLNGVSHIPSATSQPPSNQPVYVPRLNDVSSSLSTSAPVTPARNGRYARESSSGGIGTGGASSYHSAHPSPSASGSSISSPHQDAMRLRKVSSVHLSGEEADSEPSSAGSSLSGSCESIARMGMALGLHASAHQQRTVRSRAGSEETELDREVRMVTSGGGNVGLGASASAANMAGAGTAMNSATSSPLPGTGPSVKQASSSRLNLLLSSHLSHHFTPPHSNTPSIDPTVPSGPALWKRILYAPLSKNGVVWYTIGSAALWMLVHSASKRATINRTMVTFIPPFLIREAPQIFAGLTALGFLRTVMHLRKELSPFLLLSWCFNAFSFLGLLRLFQRMVRIGGHPFQQALRDARIAVPQATQEDVLTIVPVQRVEQEPLPLVLGEGQEDPLVKSAFASVSVIPSASTSSTVNGDGTIESNDSSSLPNPTPPPPPSPPPTSSLTPITQASSPLELPVSTEEKAYARIGRMTPLRWFLSTTQLTKTLAWFEEVQWRTGVVFEQIQTRQKTHALKLDVYRPKVTKPGTLLPVFLYIHGGGWITGHRSFHSLTMLYAIAKSGWMVASINYRLSPWVRHPTHLMDCKRSLAWLRTHASAFGGDASFVVVGGESAGAHLACLMALTPNILHLQPGFENVDTSVQGVVDLYGCHDFTDSHYHFRCREDPTSWLGGFEVFLHKFVIGRTLSEARYLYEMASPIFRLQWLSPGQSLPPFFASHGTHDDLIPIEDSKEFYKKLKEKREEQRREYTAAKATWKNAVASIRSLDPTAPIPEPPQPLLPEMDIFVGVPGASHGYNNMMSPRSFALNDAVTVWLTSLLKAHRVREEEIQRRRLMHGAASVVTYQPTPPVVLSPALLLERQEAAEVLREEESAQPHQQPSSATLTALSPTTPLFSLVPKM